MSVNNPSFSTKFIILTHDDNDNKYTDQTSILPNDKKQITRSSPSGVDIFMTNTFVENKYEVKYVSWEDCINKWLLEYNHRCPLCRKSANPTKNDDLKEKK